MFVWREIAKSFRRTLPLVSAREGFASADPNFHIASADPFRNRCFAKFAGLASASAGWSLEEASLGLVNGCEVEHAVGGHHSGACNPP